MKTFDEYEEFQESLDNFRKEVRILSGNDSNRVPVICFERDATPTGGSSARSSLNTPKKKLFSLEIGLTPRTESESPYARRKPESKITDDFFDRYFALAVKKKFGMLMKTAQELAEEELSESRKKMKAEAFRVIKQAKKILDE